MARNVYPGTCYSCSEHVPPGYGHFERYGGGWRIKCARCASGRILKEDDPGVKWAQKEYKKKTQS